MEDSNPGFRNPPLAWNSLLSRLHELEFILEDLDDQKRSVEEEAELPSLEEKASRQRFFFLYCAGAAILFLNITVAVIIQWHISANFVVSSLLLISLFIGFALMAYSLLSRPSYKGIQLERERERDSRLRSISARRRYTIREINQIHEMVDHFGPVRSEG